MKYRDRRTRPAPPARAADGNVVLPMTVRTMHGAIVTLDGPVWRLPRRRTGESLVSMNTGLLQRPRLHSGVRDGRYRPDKSLDRTLRRPSTFDAELVLFMLAYVAACIPRYNPLHVREGVLRAFLHFERYLRDHHPEFGPGSFGVRHVQHEVVDGYRRWCEGHLDAQGSHASSIRRFYRWVVAHRLPGFDPQVLQRLDNIRFRSRVSGHIVRFRDPLRGAFSWGEQEQIARALVGGENVLPASLTRLPGNKADRLKRLRVIERRERDRAVVWLFQRLGLRLEAAILLERRHLRRTPVPGEYVLDVPRVKRIGGTSDRDTYPRMIPSALGALLERLHPERDGEGAGRVPLLHWLPRKTPERSLWRACRRWADVHDLKTTRVPAEDATDDAPSGTNVPTRLHVFPYRFRRTMATTLAEQGASVEEIAAALDDRTLAMAAVYAEATSAVADLLGETLDQAAEWLWILGLFQGKFKQARTAQRPAVLGGAPYLADYAEFADIGEIGECHNEEPCRLEPPLSCYPCPYFWAEPNPLPHERQLIQIRRDVDRGAGRESDRVAGVLRRHAAAIVQVLAILARDRGGVAAVLDRIKAERPASLRPAPPSA